MLAHIVKHAVTKRYSYTEYHMFVCILFHVFFFLIVWYFSIARGLYISLP